MLQFKIRNESDVRWDECATIKLKIDTQKEDEKFVRPELFSSLETIFFNRKKKKASSHDRLIITSKNVQLYIVRYIII